MKAKPSPIRAQIRAMSGTSTGAAAVHNRRVVIDALRSNGALSRADLARATLLTKQTLSNIIDELERDGLVIPGETVKEGRGKPALPYHLAPGGAYSIGIQIDRHIARAVVVNLVGEVVLRRSLKIGLTDPQAGMAQLALLVAESRAELARLHPGSAERTVGLGIAMPGPFGPHAEGQGEDDYSMARWQGYPLADELAERSGLEVNVQNDASAAATAERMTGKAHGLRNGVCLYLGYGLGAGLILNRDLFNGRYGNAGEIGMIRDLGASGPASVMEHAVALGGFCARFGLDYSDAALFARIEALLRDPPAGLSDWLDEAARRLGWLAGILQLLLDPDAVILCGTAPPALIQELGSRVNAQAGPMGGHPRRLPLLIGRGDPWIVAIGAAAEPISRNFDPNYAAILKG
jgi:predicted NBD/HSP70 family sugar kinase